MAEVYGSLGFFTFSWVPHFCSVKRIGSGLEGRLREFWGRGLVWISSTKYIWVFFFFGFSQLRLPDDRICAFEKGYDLCNNMMYIDILV